MVREADARIQAASDRAVETLIRLLDSDNPNAQVRAAIEIIRLAGIGQPLPELTDHLLPQNDRILLRQYLEVIAQNQQ